jgi:carboxypeptidase family protein
MFRTRVVGAGLVALMCVILLPTAAWAQTASTGSIAGVARDTTGAVLPGVTVEAASPALIEKVRSAVTDGQGQYRVVDLRPGVYTVTFALTGFSTVIRDGIELQAGFTAPVNAELRVSNVKETITVTGQSPVVDVQNVSTQRVLTREVIDTIPTGKVIFNMAALVPGMVLTGNGAAANDVGGLAGMGSIRMSIHGGVFGDASLFLDGYSTRVLSTDSATLVHMPADANVQEYTIATSGRSAESETGGVYANVVPKDGGNTFGGSFSAIFANEHMQSDNNSDELRKRGLANTNRGKEASQFSPALGGPLKKDRLWFFTSVNRVVAETYVAGVYYNKNPQGWRYEPDFSKQEFTDQNQTGANGRVTWQATPRNRFNGHFEYYKLCHCHFGTGIAGLIAPEAAFKGTFYTNITQGTWTSTITNKLLFQAGMSEYKIPSWYLGPQSESSGRPITELAGQYAGMNYSSVPAMSHRSFTLRNIKGSLAYVTGTHSVKVGMDMLLGRTVNENFGSDINNGPGNTSAYPATKDSPYPVTYTLLNGRPSTVTYLATPSQQINNVFNPNLGLFAQDQWTIGRVTVNGGLRFDWLRSTYPDQTVPSRPFVPIAFSFPGAGLLNWKDLSPRMGVAYDVFGDGKTAIKGSLGRYVLNLGTTLGETLNPVTSVSANQTRTWTDRNVDFIVQGDPLNLAVNDELGKSDNLNFGTPLVTTVIDPDFAKGFAVRPYNWELSAGINHELFSRVSVSASYYRRSFGNFQVSQNRAVSPADYSPYCVTSPLDPRLPDGGGQQICGLFDIIPTKLGLTDILVTGSDKFGKQLREWNGMDFTTNVRLPRGILLQGGVSVGKTMLDSCDVDGKIGRTLMGNAYNQFASLLPAALGNPSTRFCHIEEPWLASMKLLGSYRLPWDFRIAATLQSDATTPYLANWTATNAQIAPTLGRNLAAGPNGTAAIQLVAPGTLYGDRLNQLDLRFGRRFITRNVRWEANVDLYNALNANPVLSQNNNYGTIGTSWGVPTSVLPARLVKLGLLMTF